METNDSRQRWATEPTLDPQVLEELRAFSDEEQDLAEELISLFLEDSPAQLIALQAALCETNLPEMERRSHRLKGSAGSIGALRLRELCAEIEEHARKGQPPQSVDAGTLTNEMEALRIALAGVRKPRQ
jgi:HPt (histidine-containing phosphotransfer) domain-containing protein